MRRKVIAAGGVVGLLALLLAVEAGPSGAGEPNCRIADERDAVCAILEVTKVVTGTPPLGTTFPVLVNCQPKNGREGDAAALGPLPPANLPPFELGLTFPETGGTREILVGFDSDCTISETPPPGCQAPQITPPTINVDVGGEGPFDVTVLNTCVAAAAAVEAAPTFTG